MKKLLLILMLILAPLAAVSETKDTTRFQMRIELSISDCIVQALGTGDFTVLSPKIHQQVMMIVNANDTLSRFMVTRYDVVDILNSTLAGISGQGKVFKRGPDYIVIIESPEYDKPILMAFGVDEGGMIYKLLLE